MDKSEYEKSLQKMYDLGYEHGYEKAKRDAEIKKLEEEIKEME